MLVLVGLEQMQISWKSGVLQEVHFDLSSCSLCRVATVILWLPIYYIIRFGQLQILGGKLKYVKYGNVDF